MLKKILTDLGLTTEEVEIYESLLENGPQSASRLSNTTPIKRTYVYEIVDRLVKRGIVLKARKHGALLFKALSPDKLVGLVQQEKNKIELLEQTLDSALPILRSKYALSDDKPVITHYEGLEGIKKVYLDTIKEKKPILSLVETSKLDPIIYKWLTTDYIKRRLKREISVQAIVASGPKTKSYIGLNKKEIRETKVISSGNFPFENEILIYGNKLAIINHKKESEKPLGIIIENENIATSFKSWFNLTWSVLN